MRSMVFAAAAAAALMLAAAAPAQEAPPAGVEVSELVVMPHDPGPAWWRVADDDSSVYILVIPNTSERSLQWDQSVLLRRLEGANGLITPFDFAVLRSIPGIASAILQSPAALFGLAGRRAPPPETVPLEQRLPEDLKARFVAAREAIGQPADRYAMLSFVRAAELIAQDYRTHANLADGEVWRTIEFEAEKRKLPTTAAYDFVLPAGRLDVETWEEAGGPECIDYALTHDFERARREKAAARAWAEGDAKGLVMPEPPAPKPGCTRAGVGVGIKAGSAMGIRFAEDFRNQHVQAIERALRKPGKTVAVLSASSPFGPAGGQALLGKDGVLERLKARGYAITTPANLRD